MKDYNMGGKFSDSKSDIEVANGWKLELEKPCCDPKNQEINMLGSWIIHAQTALDIMVGKSESQQNPFAIKLLSKALDEARVRLTEREGTGEKKR